MAKLNLLGSGARAAAVVQEDLSDTVETGKGSGLPQAPRLGEVGVMRPTGQKKGALGSDERCP